MKEDGVLSPNDSTIDGTQSPPPPSIPFLTREAFGQHAPAMVRINMRRLWFEGYGSKAMVFDMPS